MRIDIIIFYFFLSQDNVIHVNFSIYSKHEYPINNPLEENKITYLCEIN